MQGIMIQGTASDVGKSMICTAFCRILSDQGIGVAPFKSQNMSNNSYVTVLGEEIGRAQGVQAEAARTVATVNMNPILLKPENDMKSQVVLFGKKLESFGGMAYREEFYQRGMAAIDEALAKLAEDFTHLVIEGAGSPAEVNLNDRELVNMSVAEKADVPVILVADIERGGVFASIVGTLALMPHPERVKGLLINKFRGDPLLFEDGVEFLESYTGIPVLGVIPYLPDHRIEQEDSLGVRELSAKSADLPIKAVVLKHPYLSNFTDIEPLLQEADIGVRWVEQVRDIGQPDILILPGTKSTVADLRYWKAQGLEKKLCELTEHTWIIGLCGGFQMLGGELSDPEGWDGTATETEPGLGMIPEMTVEFESEKFTQRRKGFVSLHGECFEVDGYEIHSGKTKGSKEPLVQYGGLSEGYYKNKIIGTHLHGLFHCKPFRRAFLSPIRKAKNLQEAMASEPEDPYQLWADHVKAHVKWESVEAIIEGGEG